MSRRPAAVLAAAVLVPIVLAAGALAGCGADGWESKCSTDAQGVVRCAGADRPPVTGVSGELLDGGRYDVTRDRGTVVVVNFWASWCAPCRAEADDLEQTYQATKAAGVTFVGVSSRDGRDAAKAFERGRVSYPSLYDPNGAVALAFGVTQTSTPSTLVLDRQGRIAVALRRATTVQELQPLVQQLATEAQ